MSTCKYSWSKALESPVRSGGEIGIAVDVLRTRSGWRAMCWVNTGSKTSVCIPSWFVRCGGEILSFFLSFSLSFVFFFMKCYGLVRSAAAAAVPSSSRTTPPKLDNRNSNGKGKITCIWQKHQSVVTAIVITTEKSSNNTVKTEVYFCLWTFLLLLLVVMHRKRVGLFQNYTQVRIPFSTCFFFFFKSRNHELVRHERYPCTTVPDPISRFKSRQILNPVRQCLVVDGGSAC